MRPSDADTRLPLLAKPLGYSLLDRRAIALLRALGRVRVAQTSAIRDLFYGDVERRTMYRQLAALVAEGVIWRTQVYQGRAQTKTGGRMHGIRLPQVYGLTAAGVEVLRMLDVEGDEKHYTRLRARPRDAPLDRALPLAHDLGVSWWCFQLLADVRRNPYVQGVFIQTEYVSSVDQHGAVLQRIDAVILLRINRSDPRTDIGEIPWWDGEGRYPGDSDIRLALEWDTGSEALPVLLGKAVMYRDLTDNELYLRAVGGPFVPVFVVPTHKRMVQVADEFYAAWPETTGMITTLAKAVHPVHGVLWGEYRKLSNAEPASLLTPYSQDARLRIKRGTPITLEQWNAWQHAEERG